MRNNVFYRCLTVLLVTILFFVYLYLPVKAEDEQVYAEYTIEEGDFLSIVAMMFNTTVDDILAINNIPDVNAISIGTRVKIPTLAGVEGSIITKYINIGDTLDTLSILSGMEPAKLGEINTLVSPTELYIGSLLTTIHNEKADTVTAVSNFSSGESLLAKSVELGMSPAVLQKINRADGVWDFADSQILFGKVNGNGGNFESHSVASFVDTIEIKQLPLTQGETHVVHVQAENIEKLSGNVGNYPLRFFRDGDSNDWYAMLGIDAMETVGLNQLTISGITVSQERFDLNQPVIIAAGIFATEVVEGVDSSTLEEENQALDTQTVKSLTMTSNNRSWGTMMSFPVDEPYFVSGFGNRRTYNNGVFSNYHSGVDFGVYTASNINIYAAADGTVIFADLLPIHGNFTVIDHGWGVYTSYSHQSQLLVSAGQEVKRGDTIGLIGSTGRSVGPHLHWEVIVNSTYVNPVTWLSTQFP
ncbi:MAG: LysM peptidoglycan-binding domain-containing M23 family metallopeptidase [Anaerolineaceae bacterium]|nr:LysM peptidoglycan-binding domain-containing M23 family metallopeptidase [Anaerolineaceae bacterium]